MRFENDPFAPLATESGGRQDVLAERRRVFMIRRLGAVGAAVLVLILLVLAVRGCLNARQERAFENYASDLSTLASESEQVSKGFFGRLEGSGRDDPSQAASQIAADRSAVEGLLSRARGLDPPGDLSGAQEDVVLAFELWRDGIAVVAESVSTPLSGENGQRPLGNVTAGMESLAAGDVFYRRARTEIEATLQEQGIDAEVPSSQVLPSFDWLDEARVQEALGS